MRQVFKAVFGNPLLLLLHQGAERAEQPVGRSSNLYCMELRSAGELLITSMVVEASGNASSL